MDGWMDGWMVGWLVGRCGLVWLGGWLVGSWSWQPSRPSYLNNFWLQVNLTCNRHPSGSDRCEFSPSFQICTFQLAKAGINEGQKETLERVFGQRPGLKF